MPGCESDTPSDTKTAPAPSQETLSPTGEPTAERVQAFLAAPGPEATTIVEWPTTLHANAMRALASAPLTAAVTDVDPIDSAAEALSRIDMAAEGQAQAKAYKAAWKQHADCKVAPAKPHPATGLDAAALQRLPADTQKVAEALGKASNFSATCGDKTFFVAMNAEGRVLAFDNTTPLELEPDPEGENRFLEYMNEPDPE